LITALLGTPAAAQTVSAPAVVQAGLDSFAASGYRVAISVWLKDSPLVKDGAPHQTVLDEFQKLQDDFGTPRGSEILRVLPLGSKVARVYAILLFQSGPGYLTVDCYLSNSTWIVTGFTISGKPDVLLTAMLAKPETK